MVVQRLLRQAIKKTGAVEIGREPSPEEYEDALESANSMLNSWSATGLITFHIVSENFPLVIGQSLYTMGVSGDFDTVRPSQIAGGFTRDSNNLDDPIKIIARDDYNYISDKNVSGRPCGLYVYPSSPLAIINTDVVPDEAYTLFIDSLKPLTVMILDAELTLPPEYEELIVYNLAARLCPDYSVQVPQVVAAIADATYKALSIQPVPLARFEGLPGCKGKRYNIYAGY